MPGAQEAEHQDNLPKKYHGTLSMKLQATGETVDYAQAPQELRKVQTRLASSNQVVGRSLEKGFEETLMVNRLQLPSQLRRLLAMTNVIESCR